MNYELAYNVLHDLVNNPVDGVAAASTQIFLAGTLNSISRRPLPENLPLLRYLHQIGADTPVREAIRRVSRATEDQSDRADRAGPFASFQKLHAFVENNELHLNAGTWSRFRELEVRLLEVDTSGFIEHLNWWCDWAGVLDDRRSEVVR